MPEQERKSLLEQALEVAVYAPVGLAIAARGELPGLIEKGRAQVLKQIALYKMMGQYAVSEGQKDFAKRAERVVETVAGARATVEGMVQATPAPARVEPQPQPNPARDARTPPAVGTRAPSPEVFPEIAAAPSNGSTPPAGPAPDPAGLAIPGYATLSASQVVQRLAGLNDDDLEAVRHFEAATRGRKTILGRIAQLQADRTG